MRQAGPSCLQQETGHDPQATKAGKAGAVEPSEQDLEQATGGKKANAVSPGTLFGTTSSDEISTKTK